MTVDIAPQGSMCFSILTFSPGSPGSWVPVVVTTCPTLQDSRVSLGCVCSLRRWDSCPLQPTLQSAFNSLRRCEES